MKKIFAVCCVAILSLTGCANEKPHILPYPAVTSTHLGKLINVRDYNLQIKQNNDAAVIGGAIVGGLLGNQVGKGRGRTVGTLAGAAAGAYSANELTESYRNIPMTELEVLADNGQRYTINQEKRYTFYMGQRVRVTFVNNLGKVSPY